MTMARYLRGNPVMIDYLPGVAYNAGDVIVVGGAPFVAAGDNPLAPSLSLIQGALAAALAEYVMAADAVYPNGTYVLWDSAKQQVTTTRSSTTVPFGWIVGGPLLRLDDGGPSGAASLCVVFHLPLSGALGVLPSSIQTQFGSAALATALATFGEEGNLYRAVGNPFSANLADTTDDILAGFVLPANAFDGVGNRGLQLTAQGKFGATANNKKVRLWLNPTMAGQAVANGVITGGTVIGAGAGVMLYDSTAQVGNAVAWSILAQLFKYGIANSNTQYAQIQPIFGTVHGGITMPTFPTLAENAPINVVLTGSSSTTGAANDVILNFFEANAMN